MCLCPPARLLSFHVPPAPSQEAGGKGSLFHFAAERAQIVPSYLNYSLHLSRKYLETLHWTDRHALQTADTCQAEAHVLLGVI